jgi:putative spermidine/putrescine transport system permease protein
MLNLFQSSRKNPGIPKQVRDVRPAVLHTAWAVMFSFPLLVLLMLSFAGQWRFPSVLPEIWSAANWKGLLKNQDDLLRSLFISGLISTIVAAVATSLGFWMSRTIAFHPKKNLLTDFAYLPFILSPVIFASVLNFYFILFGLSGAMFGVMLAQLFITLPFAMLLFADYWDVKLKSLEGLVFTLGGSSRQALLKVIIPVSKNMLLLCFFQTFLISWFDYGLTSVIGVGKIQTLTVKVFQYIGEANPYYAAVSSCLLMFPPVIVLFINKKYLFNTLK